MNLNQQAAQLLRDAAALIEDPKRWTQKAYARDHRGETVAIDNPAATSWCVIGAMTYVEQRTSNTHAFDLAADRLRDIVSDIPNFNDTHTHDEVLRAMREAAESLETQETTNA